MPIPRPTVLVIILLLAHGVGAQAVQRKHLLTTLGGGVGVVDLSASVDSFSTTGTEVGSVRFAFGYALGDRWSLGFHYDRIGTDRHPGSVDRVRFTTYLLEGTWRPWVGRLAAVELHGAFGASIMALRQRDARLPYQANGSAFALGARYIHLISGTVGVFLAADRTGSSRSAITLDGEVQRDPAGDPITFDWVSTRINAGIVVRF